MTEMVSTLKCVVLHTRGEHTAMRCQLPHDTVELEVPRHIVPCDLQHRGACVWFTEADGHMLVKSREFEQQVLDKIDTFGDPDFEAWLNQLEQ